MAALECISRYMLNSGANSEEIKKLFRERTQAKKLLCENFIDLSLRFQQLAISYLGSLDLLKSDSAFVNSFLTESQVPKLL